MVALLGAMFFLESYIRESNEAGSHVPYLGSMAVGLLNPIFILCFAPISRRIAVALANYGETSSMFRIWNLTVRTHMIDLETALMSS